MRPRLLAISTRFATVFLLACTGETKDSSQVIDTHDNEDSEDTHASEDSEDTGSETDSGIEDSSAESELQITVIPVLLGDSGLNSSTRFDLEITGVDDAEIYQITAITENGFATTWTGGASYRLEGLWSDTLYSVEVVACADLDCNIQLGFGSNTLTTPEEVWQFKGTGHNLAGLSQVASDGNAKVWGLWYGSDADNDLAGKVQLYYGTTFSSEVQGSSIGVATSFSPTNGDDPSTFLPLQTHHGQAGIVAPPTPVPLISMIGTAQAVPLSSGLIRLYFEANGADGHTRILSIDSVDGQTGLDFHAGAATICKTALDYTGGSCTVSPVLGVLDDAGSVVPEVQNVRQFKIGYPTLDHWTWDESPGTFMFFTVDGGGECDYPGHANQGYAVWDGAGWEPLLREDGCPEALESIQAPMPLHIGGVQYKMYHGDPSVNSDAIQGSNLPFLGPKQILYADGQQNGDPTLVDFDDWEPRTSAHDMTFLWPDGSEFTATQEGYLDDFVFMTPTGNLDLQVAYVVITDGSLMPRPAFARLLNP